MNKYIATPRKYEQKDWLYEQYWGEFRSGREIAKSVGVSESTIRDRMNEHGIPRRTNGFTRDNTISPFAGFYDENTPGRTDTASRTVYDEDYEPERKPLNWQMIAEKDPAVSDKALL